MMRACLTGELEQNQGESYPQQFMATFESLLFEKYDFKSLLISQNFI